MKRRDLQPGTFFRYCVNPVHVYWSPETGAEKPPGVMFSGLNPHSGDGNFEVVVLEGDRLATALRAEAERHDAALADEAAALAERDAVLEATASDVNEFDEEPEAD